MTALATTQRIRYALEPTLTMPAVRRPARPARRRRARTGLPSRAGTIALIGLVLILLAGVFAAGSL